MDRERRMRGVRAWSVRVAAACLLAAAVAAPAATAKPRACRAVDVPVTVAGRTHSLRGLLCADASKLEDTVQVLMAGATEGGLAYWDFPHPDFYEADPATWRPLRARYSYVEHLTQRGYASLTIDRIGTGDSTRPPAHEVTIESNAEVLHQVVAMLRDGTLGSYRKVVAVGRSLSGPIAFVEAATYGDLDGIVIQSFRHHQEPPFLAFAATLAPAQLEERLAHTPAGYLTTRPGARREFFFTDRADPRVVEHEEAIRDTITTAEVATFPPSFDVSRSVPADLPILSVVGERDPLFCTPGCPRAAEEAASWPNPDCFTSVVVQDAGHDMNLEPGGRQVFEVLTGWIERTFADSASLCASSAPDPAP